MESSTENQTYTNLELEPESKEAELERSSYESLDDYRTPDASFSDKFEKQVSETEALWKHTEAIMDEGSLDSNQAETLFKLVIETSQSIDWLREQFANLEEGMKGHQRYSRVVDYGSMLHKDNISRDVAYFEEIGRKLLSELRNAEKAISLSEEELSRVREDEAEIHKAAEELRERLRRETEEKLAKLNRPLGLGLLPGTRRKNRAVERKAEEALELHAELDRLGEKGEEVLGNQFRYGKGYEEARQLIIRIQSSSHETREQFKSLMESYEKLRLARKKSEEAEESKNKHAHEVKKVSKEIEKALRDSFFKTAAANGELKTEVAKAVEKAERVSEEIEKFERDMERDVFDPLGISVKHERDAMSVNLPKETPEIVAEVRERSFRNIREVIRSFVAHFEESGIDKKELVEELIDTVSRIRSEAFIGFNDDSFAIEDILRDGEIRPVFHLSGEKKRRTSTGIERLHRREEVERAMGFRKNEHPIYLALGSSADAEDGPASQYGAFHLSYSTEKLQGRAVCTIGDSMNTLGVPFSLRKSRWWKRRINS